MDGFDMDFLVNPHAIIQLMTPAQCGKNDYKKKRLKKPRLLESLRQSLVILLNTSRCKLPLPVGLFLFSLLVYVLVRVIGLEEFPIYFFTDEAAQTILAQDFLRDGFTNYEGDIFPTYFENGGKYNLGVSVYAQVIPLILFGRSIFVTRFVTVFLASFAAVAVGLILRNIFKLKLWWMGVLVLSMTPVWFLHSRTAFETGLAVSFYALFLYFYFAYRFVGRKHLFLSLAFGALAFYSYSPMQAVVLASGLIFLLLDGPYHLRGKWYLLGGGGLLIVLSLPYIRFLFSHVNESINQLQMLDSYWVAGGTLSSKLITLFSEYIKGFNPFFWYGSHADELSRHVMLGYGHLPRVLLPFLLVGFVYGLTRLRDPRYRILIAVLLVSPVGASIVQLGITRILVLVIPATIYTAIGLSCVLDRILPRIKLTEKSVIGIVFFCMAVGNVYMLVDVLRNGALWFRDYSLAGMQYGARQIFPEVTKYLDRNPDRNLILSPSWGNGTDVVARFMLGDPIPVELGSIDGYISDYREIPKKTTFVMTPDEYGRFLQSNKFSNTNLAQILNYPDGTPGFFFVDLEYAPNARTQFDIEREMRRALVVGRVEVNGIVADVRFSRLDMGVIQQAFDGDFSTPIRTLEANPFVIEMDCLEPILTNEIILRIGGTTTSITIYIETADGTHYQLQNYATESPRPQDVVFTLEQGVKLTHIRMEINSVYEHEPAHVHLWEVTFQNQEE
jgi:hypothetical protein